VAEVGAAPARRHEAEHRHQQEQGDEDGERDSVDHRRLLQSSGARRRGLERGVVDRYTSAVIATPISTQRNWYQ
jgi:hypothetical protein